MASYILRMMAAVGLIFTALVGLAVGVGYGLPDDTWMLYTNRTHADRPQVVLQARNRLLEHAILGGEGETSFASWSPDGKHIGYVSSGSEGSSRFSFTDAPGRYEGQVAFGLKSLIAAPIWSPDSQKVLLSGYDAQDVLQSALVNIVSGESTLLQQYVAAGIWSPDSGEIVYIIYSEDGLLHFYRIAIGCTTQTPDCESKTLDIFKTDTAYAIPVFSPDGQAIAVSQNDNSDWKIVVARLSCAELVEACVKGFDTVANTPAVDSSPMWSPDSKQLAFAAGWSELCVVQLQTGEIQTFQTPAIIPYLKNWSADGKWIAYVSEQSGTDVYILNVDSGVSTRLYPDWHTAELPAWRPLPH